MHFLPPFLPFLPPFLSSHIIAVAVIRLVAKVITRDDGGDGKSWRRCGKWSVSDKEGVRGEVGGDGDARKEGSLGMC